MIAVGTHACVLVNDGRAFCWGDNRYGQLGDGTTEPRAQPTPVATQLRFADIAAGTHSTCALTREGQLHCWGRNDFGALGVGSSGEGQRKLVPTTALTMVRFRTLGGGGTYCGLSLDQHAYCWGSVSGSFDPDTYRAPGNCSAKYYLWYVGDQCLVPTRVDTDLAFARLGSGRAADCATTDAGTAYCWGEGWLGTLGNGTGGSGVHAVTPVAVAGGIPFLALSSGGGHVCGLDARGEAYCWGNNFVGQLGDGFDITSGGSGRAVPGRVVGGLSFVEIDAGTSHTCGLSGAGEVWCWGAGTEGQLGRDPALGNSSSPVRVALP